MTKAASGKEAPEKGLIDKGLDRLVEMREHAAAKAEEVTAAPAAEMDKEEADERRPLWVRLAILSVPVIAGAVVRRIMARRQASKTHARKAAKPRRKATRARTA